MQRVKGRIGWWGGVVMAAASLIAVESYATVVAPPRPLTTEQITTSLGFVEKLINSSSVAREVEQSNFAPAIAYLNAARRVYKQAQEELARKELAKAAARRDEAIHLMMEAGHLSRLAMAPDNRAEGDYQKRLASIRALLDAHRRVAQEKGQKESTEALLGKISGNMAAAEAMAKEGNYTTALSEANTAYAMVRGALNEIRGGDTLGTISTQVTESRGQETEEYESRLRSINALHEAYQRIAADKSLTSQAASLGAQTKTLLEKAALDAKENNYRQANGVLKVAYAQIRDALEKLRGGETLVRSLNFANAEEEYHYELDRNETYKMLIKMLMEEKKTMAVDARVQQFLDEAYTRRKAAEEQAAGGDYAAAIKTMEQSTQSLIQAMRNAGIFIPG